MAYSLYVKTDSGYTPLSIESSSGTSTAGDYLPLSGGAMTGPLFLSDDPTSGSQAATKSYVDSHVPSQVGTGTVGSSTKPIYLLTGMPMESYSTVGSGTNPVYMSTGTITACDSTVGSSTKPVYMSSGTITACGSTVGSSTKPVYMSSGTITACSKSLSDYLPLTGGTCTGAVKATSFQATSDARLKEGQEERYYDLSALHCKRYRLQTDGTNHIGLIAQEVQTVLPEAVGEDDKGYLTLDYNAVVAALVGEVNALKERIKALEAV